ncbi:MAG: hypoxanthine phosphoribosyltransferase [Planctomycetaceae bacterium]|nr:hypoxanthine phosphoribosyltransferase [Planctomycetaceae bacterium]
MNVSPLIHEEEIAEAVAQLGRRLSDEYRDRELTILGVLTGSLIFVADLMRQIEVPHQVGLLQASSYRGTATSPGRLELNLDFLPNLQGRDLLLVDDIFDTGRTITGICEKLKEQQPRSIQVAVLLWKKARTVVETVPDFTCFEIPDQFVVGYGLDYDGLYRHLPYIGVVETDTV